MLSRCLLFSSVVLIFALVAGAAPDPKDETILIRLARQKVEDVRALVESGVLPRVHLMEAERAYANAKDDEDLRKKLYGADLTPAASEELLAWTVRRIEERKAHVESIRKLVEQQVLPANELGFAQGDLARAEKEHDWAETRAHVVEELAAMPKTEQDYMADAAKLQSKARAKSQAKYDAENVVRRQQQAERIKAMCAGIYLKTANKKISDLTVMEDQQVRACQHYHLYGPQ